MTPSEAQNTTPDPVETARAEARAEAMREANSAIAIAKLEAEAARKGVDVSGSLNYMNTSAFLAEDGSVNSEAITEFVSSLTPPAPVFDQDVIRTGGRGTVPRPDFTDPKSFKNMSKAQIRQVVESGALNKLVR